MEGRRGEEGREEERCVCVCGGGSDGGVVMVQEAGVSYGEEPWPRDRAEGQGVQGIE